MSLNSTRIFTAAVAGGTAGLITFGILEPSVRISELTRSAHDLSSMFSEVLHMFGLNGMLTGLAIAVTDEITGSSSKRLLLRASLGALLGLVFGAVSGVLAQLVFSILIAVSLGAAALPARTLGWAMLGAGVGMAVGIANYSGRRVRYGLLGGAIGGGLGGVLFDVLSGITGAGTISRLVGFTAIGAFTGAAVMLIEESRKTAWVTRLVGKNEGKQYVINKQCARIGRNELFEIPIFADTTVAKLHAEIQTSDWSSFQLVDRTGTPSTLLNGNPVSNVKLKNGDIITVGNTNLAFGQKGQASIIPDFPWQSSQVQNISQQVPIQVQSSICPFCGQPKDAVTGMCPCSPASPQAQVPNTQTGSASLIGLQGVYAGSIFTLSNPTTIGRLENNNIVLSMDGGVSRNHATITLGPQGWGITDNNSSNGVYVNQVKLPFTVLRNGDQVHIGGTTFEFRQN